MPDKNYSRTVYTTETGRVCPDCGQPLDGDKHNCPPRAVRPKGDGVVRVSLDRKGRGGKSVTLVTGLPGSDEEIKALAADLKRRCCAGGALKEGVIEIQGDHRDTLLAALRARGFTVKKSGG
ncbi:MAG: translation initiation factor Sui1 [Chloroflexi bacterium]|nr:MAG: translation initiation factor Sui1 [Chloroflexota bacterium]